MDPLVSSLFVKKQYVQNGLLSYFTEEDMKKWEEELNNNRLGVEQYQALLALPQWQLGFVPFILAGLRIFSISPGDPWLETRSIPPSSSKVLSIFWKAWESLRKGNLLMERCELLLSVPLSTAILKPGNIVYNEIQRDFCSNANRYPISIKPVKVIVWAVLNNIQLQQELLELLCIYQERPKEEFKETLINGRHHLIKKVHQVKKTTKPQENEIEYLAAAQVLWFREPGASKSKIMNNPILKRFGPGGGYTKDSKHPLKLLSCIDPAGARRPKGGFRGSVQNNILPRSIPGLFQNEDGVSRIDLNIAKPCFQAYVRALHYLDGEITPEEISTNPVIK